MGTFRVVSENTTAFTVGQGANKGKWEDVDGYVKIMKGVGCSLAVADHDYP